MAAADRMIVAAAVAALVAGAHGKTWCETNFKGFKTGGGELGPPVQADSWDACAEECGKEPRCGWIDWNSETLDCVVKSGQGGAPQMGNGWMCGYCHNAEDPPLPAPPAAPVPADPPPRPRAPMLDARDLARRCSLVARTSALRARLTRRFSLTFSLFFLLFSFFTFSFARFFSFCGL